MSSLQTLRLNSVTRNLTPNYAANVLANTRTSFRSHLLELSANIVTKLALLNSFRTLSITQAAITLLMDCFRFEKEYSGS